MFMHVSSVDASESTTLHWTCLVCSCTAEVDVATPCNCFLPLPIQLGCLSRLSPGLSEDREVHQPRDSSLAPGSATASTSGSPSSPRQNDQWVPWEELAKPSIEAAAERWRGLQLRTVTGRGHVIEQWEGDLLNEFMHSYAKEAYD
ncbi:unnamed protein product [Durusdinium trenchii]|uniref:Uncharacterized protein n=1 Tax=Durusdinium trenchii TaxID=1381693 RepID=A0ABP0NZ72_9DINO